MKNNFVIFFKIINSQRASSGFTLIELLIAASLTTLVVGLSGFGLVSMTERNKTAKAETERRVELNRALEFITDEVKEAKPIAIDAFASLSTLAPDFDSSSRTPVLTLQIPGIPQRVIYYIASASSPWLGPKAIYRWGPKFLNDGKYDPNDLDDPVNDPDNWNYELLGDLITDTPLTSNPCDSSWSLNPPLTSAQGFYTCVDSTGRSAKIYIKGKLSNAYNDYTTKPFEVNTKAFARPFEIPSNGGIPDGNVVGGGIPPFTTGGGTLTTNQPSNMSIQVLGGQITCGSPGPIIPTTTTVHSTTGGSTTNTTLPSTNQTLNLSNVASGTTVTVTGTALASSCIGSNPSYNSATNVGTQVLALRNGDRPPLFTPYGNQQTIDSFLKGYINQDTGKITLADNQVIFLFELGTTDRNTVAYDIQDLVVLATVSRL